MAVASTPFLAVAVADHTIVKRSTPQKATAQENFIAPVYKKANPGVIACHSHILSEACVCAPASCFPPTPNHDDFFIVVDTQVLAPGVGTIHLLVDIQVHPAYDSVAGKNNVAILKVSVNIVFTPTCQPIRLPPNKDWTPGSNPVYCTGYGVSDEGTSGGLLGGLLGGLIKAIVVILANLVQAVVTTLLTGDQCAAQRPGVDPTNCCAQTCIIGLGTALYSVDASGLTLCGSLIVAGTCKTYSVFSNYCNEDILAFIRIYVAV